MRNMKKLIMLALGLLCSNVGAAVDEMHWFKTELACAGAGITVHAYCQETDNFGEREKHNSLCSRQTMRIELPGRTAVERNLLERQPDTGEVPLLLSSLRCVSAGDKVYLSGLMGNGGNCPECERSVLFGLDGKWKQDGGRWLIGAREKRAILAQQRAWRASEQLFIFNATPDTARDAAEDE